MAQRYRWLALGAYVTFFVMSMAIASSPALTSHAVTLATFMRTNPWSGAALHMILSTAVTTSGVPFVLFDLAAAWVYPAPVAFCMLSLAKTLGSIFCFIIIRNLMPWRCKRRLAADEAVTRVKRILAESPIFFGTLFRLAYMPTSMKNYGLALLGLDFSSYVWSCVLASGLGVTSQVYLGAYHGDAYLGLAEAPELFGDPLATTAAVIGVFALVFVLGICGSALTGEDLLGAVRCDQKFQ